MGTDAKPAVSSCPQPVFTQTIRSSPTKLSGTVPGSAPGEVRSVISNQSEKTGCFYLRHSISAVLDAVFSNIYLSNRRLLEGFIVLCKILSFQTDSEFELPLPGAGGRRLR